MERHREQGLRTGGLARCFTSSTFPPSPWHRLPVRQGIDCLVLSWKGDCCRQDQRRPDLESQGWKTLPGPNLPPISRKEAGAKAQHPCTEQAGDLGAGLSIETRASGPPGCRHAQESFPLGKSCKNSRHSSSHFPCICCVPDTEPAWPSWSTGRLSDVRRRVTLSIFQLKHLGVRVVSATPRVT